MSTLDSVQRTIFSTLANDSTLRGLVSGVFDEVPTGTSFPYITLGDMTEVGFNTFDRDGADTTITIHIWSKYRGNSEIFRILDRVNALLDGAALSTTPERLVKIEYENGVTSHEPETRHFVARYRLVLQEVQA